MIGKIVDVLKLGSRAIVQIETDTDSAQMVCEDIQGDLCDIDIKLHKESKKRSMTANRYLWQLCQKIAERADVFYIDVYRDAIQNAGVFIDATISEKSYDDIKAMWQKNGLGWLVIETARHDGGVDCNMFKGSSSYNTAEMSKLVDYVVEVAKSYNIQTLTDRELSLLKDEWR